MVAPSRLLHNTVPPPFVGVAVAVRVGVFVKPDGGVAVDVGVLGGVAVDGAVAVGVEVDAGGVLVGL